MAPQKTSKTGKTYYEQANPEERGFARKTLRLGEEEMKAFEEDASVHGSLAQYIRHLWRLDRERRGLAPWSPTPKNGEPS